MAKDTFGKNIAIIGGGHMGSALAKGFANAGVPAARIDISNDASGNVAAAKNADWIFLAVKPSVVADVLESIANVSEGKVIVSLAAGVTVESMKKSLRGARCFLARIMPNIPVAYGEGVVGLYAGDVSGSDTAELKRVLNGLGLLVEVKKEGELDIITLIAGCGPGVVAFLVAMVAKNAQRLGIAEDEALAIALKTFKGTLAQLDASGMTPAQLAEAVATKGGVTEAILSHLSGSFESEFADALQSGCEKIKAIRS